MTYDELTKTMGMLNWKPSLYGSAVRRVKISRYGNEVDEQINKFDRTISELRWHENKSHVRKFAADCAEDVLAYWEAEYPGDMRPHLSINAARDYADCNIGLDKLREAHEAASDAAKCASPITKCAASAASAASEPIGHFAFRAAHSARSCFVAAHLPFLEKGAMKAILARQKKLFRQYF